MHSVLNQSVCESFRKSCLCLHVRTRMSSRMSSCFFSFKLCQISAIKERTKALSALEREISKYVDEGRDEHKEVAALLLVSAG